jgi:aspartyl-tRNA(Asn)/glutamyl-tRNA(Gln) amidotransferase subunit C
MAETLTPDSVRRIATLARLELTADEIETFAEQLTAILAYADQVQQVDTSGIAESANRGLTPQSRDDDPAPCLPRDAVLGQAPDADRGAGVFKVPRVIGS